MKACTAENTRTPAVTDTFEVADDGVNTDVAVSDELRQRIRANRLLYMRALKSRGALRRFVADSVALVDPLARAAIDTGPPPDSEDPSWGIWTDGAFAYVVEGGGRRGLNWHSLRAAAGPAGRALVDALAALDQGDLGAWIEQRTDFGGCHQPERAEKTLTDLATAWNGAPTYIRDAFKAYLLARLTEMAEDDCFCDRRDDHDKVTRALERNAAILDTVPNVGAQIARKLRTLAAGPRARFACLGPG